MIGRLGVRQQKHTCRYRAKRSHMCFTAAGQMSLTTLQCHYFQEAQQACIARAECETRVVRDNFEVLASCPAISEASNATRHAKGLSTPVRRVARCPLHPPWSGSSTQCCFTRRQIQNIQPRGMPRKKQSPANSASVDDAAAVPQLIIPSEAQTTAWSATASHHSHTGDSVFSKGLTRTTATSPEPGSRSLLPSNEPQQLRAPEAKALLAPSPLVLSDNSKSLSKLESTPALEMIDGAGESAVQSLHASTPLDPTERQETPARPEPVEEQHPQADHTDWQHRLRGVKRAHETVARTRESLLSAKSHLDQERGACKAAEHYLDESQDEFMTLIADVMQGRTIIEDYNRLSDLHQRLKSDRSVFDQMNARVLHMENVADNLQFILGDAEKQFDIAIQHLLNIFPEVEDDILNTTDINYQPSEERPGRQSTPIPLHNLWSAMGDLQDFVEQLYELDTDHQVQVAEVERLREQDMPVERSLEELNREWEYHRDALNKKINDRQLLIEQLKAECDEQNIDLDRWRRVRSQASSSPSLKSNRLREEQEAALSNMFLPSSEPTPVVNDSWPGLYSSYSQATPITRRYPMLHDAEEPKSKVETWLSDTTPGTSAYAHDDIETAYVRGTKILRTVALAFGREAQPRPQRVRHRNHASESDVQHED